jgi:cytochrome c551/c552
LHEGHRNGSGGIDRAGAAGAASAQEALAKSDGCLNCHAVDTKKVGPAFKDVAAKYKGQADAEAKLVDKLTKGQGHPGDEGEARRRQGAGQVGAVAIEPRCRGRKKPASRRLFLCCAPRCLGSWPGFLASDHPRVQVALP